LDGTSAELIGRQCYRLPLWAAAFHKLTIIIQRDIKKYISILGEIINVSAIKINVDILHLVDKDKNSLMAWAKNFLPFRQPINILSCDPTLKAR